MLPLLSRLTLLSLLAALGTGAQAQVPLSTGEVTKIDKAQARITLRHGEIKHLDMPAMNMVFRVRDPKALEGLAVGDRVRFTAEKIDGHFTVTSVTKGP
jgi:Cu(I)/Ag(I) efflux system periplasmic protein CusF